MKNTLPFPSQKRNTINTAILVTAIFLLLTLIFLCLFHIKLKKDFNGKTQTVQGVVTQVKIGKSLFIRLDDENSYNCNLVRQTANISDWNVLQGKTVTIVVSQESSNNSPLVLGISVPDVTEVNFEDTLAQKTQENTTGRTVCTIVAVVLACVACVFIVLRTRTTQNDEIPFVQLFVHGYSKMQPSKKRTDLGIIVKCSLALSFIVPYVVGAIMEKQQSEAVVGATVFGLYAAMLTATAILTLFVNKIIRTENVVFYKESYPFDIADLSFSETQKGKKQELQQQIKKELQENPHCYSDELGRNIKFTEQGAELYDFQSESGSVSGAFDTDFATLVAKFTYEQLNFEALPFCVSTQCPLVVVVKSRLSEKDGCYKFLPIDLHFCLSKNLLKTLETFNVHVENLHKILDNKEAYMKEYSFRKKRKG